ncbi:MAG: response regulator transcription factor [Candidatus Obscuribacterales bacterium]|nr:response regulator transcription factor [Candidatus Obscuribacterales bacterium]
MAKVLVVEDESLIAETIVHSLNCNHYDTEVAEDGETALEMLLSRKYDLVILDWNLPKMSGPEVCRRYNSSKGNTLILMLTGKASVNDKVEGLDAGADDYLTKPFDLRELHARVNALLNRAGLRQRDNL